MKKCFLIFLCLSSTLMGKEVLNNCKIAETVCKRAFTSIAQVEKEKIFLKSNKLHFFQGKIYVEAIRGKAIALPAIFACEKGLYIKTDGFNIFNLWQCKECENWNHNWEQPTHCGVCGAPRPS